MFLIVLLYILASATFVLCLLKAIEAIMYRDNYRIYALFATVSFVFISFMLFFDHVF